MRRIVLILAAFALLTGFMFTGGKVLKEFDFPPGTDIPPLTLPRLKCNVNIKFISTVDPDHWDRVELQMDRECISKLTGKSLGPDKSKAF